MSEASLAYSTSTPASRHRSTLAGIDRGKVASAIERLIALLDALDGDPEAEATSLEFHGGGFVASGPDDAEDSHDAEAWSDDNGIVDPEAIFEQGFPGIAGQVVL